jgi:hypothetical protein
MYKSINDNHKLYNYHAIRKTHKNSKCFLFYFILFYCYGGNTSFVIVSLIVCENDGNSAGTKRRQA